MREALGWVVLPQAGLGHHITSGGQWMGQDLGDGSSSGLKDISRHAGHD